MRSIRTRIALVALGMVLVLLGLGIVLVAVASAKSPAQISWDGARAVAGYDIPHSTDVQVELRRHVYNSHPDQIVTSCDQPVASYYYGRTELAKYNCAGALVPGSCPGVCPFLGPQRRAYAWQYRRGMRVMRNELAETFRKAASPKDRFRVPRRGLDWVSSVVYDPADPTRQGFFPGQPVTQIEFFFDKRATRVKMIRLKSNGCAVVTLRGGFSRSYCGLPMA